jgi:hypothetical protein
MKALEVLVNGRRLCLAGSGPTEFTWASVTLNKGDQAAIQVAGSRGKTVPIWVEEDPFQEGDEFVVRIVDVDPGEIDQPVQSPPAWTEFPQVKIPFPQVKIPD